MRLVKTSAGRLQVAPGWRVPIGTLALCLLLVVAPAAFGDCKAVDAKYPHGVAKNFKVIKKASGLTGRPFVSAKLDAKLKRAGEDRDGDGVDCEM